MAPVSLPFSGISRLFQGMHLPQMMQSLSGVSPHDLGLALKRLALKRRPKGIPPLNSDFYDIRDLLSADERAILKAIRSYMEERVAPVIGGYWERGAFPHELVPSFAQLIRETWGRTPYAIDNLGPVLSGMGMMELARVDPSIDTFFGVHGGLAMGSISLCGSEEQRAQWLPPMARLELIGAWSLTEPDVGSDVAAGLTTTARRDGDELGAQRREEVDRQRDLRRPERGLGARRGRRPGEGLRGGAAARRATPSTKLEDKIALRVVQNADITLTSCRVPEANRLQNARGFRDVAPPC